MVLQRERPGGIRTGGGMAAEAGLIRAGGAAGVPVADVVATGGDDGLAARGWWPDASTARPSLAGSCGTTTWPTPGTA